MGGYVFITTTRTINDYINGCLQKYKKNRVLKPYWSSGFEKA